MIFEFRERGNKELYDELLYAITYINKLRKKEKVHIHGLIKNIYFCLMYGGFVLVLMTYFYLVDNNILYIFCDGMLGLLLLYGVIYLVYTKRVIKKFVNDDDTKIFRFDKEEIVYSDKEKTLNLNWKDINKIVLGKYSIILVPEKSVNVFVAFPISFLDNLKKVLKKYKYEELLK